MSASTTVVPLAVGLALLYTGRGSDEGVRYRFGMTSVALGAIAGPTSGHLYAGSGSDALITFFLRTLTGSVMLIGMGIRLRGDPDQAELGRALGYIGGITTGLIGAYDIYAAGRNAQETRYRRGHTQLAPDARWLTDIATCGPIPCPTGFGAATSVPAP